MSFKKILLFCSVLLLFVEAPAQFNLRNLEVNYSIPEREFTFRKLRLYPVRASQSFLAENRHMDKYVCLNTAISTGKVIITESSKSGTVNNLLIRNLSPDTIFVMSGEILQGGKQDRVVADDLLIPPMGGRRNLQVFCVERGRWKYKGGENDESFKEYYGMANEHLRKIVDKEHDQQEVWKEVSKSNRRDNIESYTEAYTDHALKKEFLEQEAEYFQFFADKFKNNREMVGVVAVTGNYVVGCDLFASSNLFHQEFPKLVYSYLDEAISYGDVVNIDTDTVRRYMEQLLGNPRSQEDFIRQRGKMFKVGQRIIHISTY